jgi:hypothetical protein
LFLVSFSVLVGVIGESTWWLYYCIILRIIFFNRKYSDIYNDYCRLNGPKQVNPITLSGPKMDKISSGRRERKRNYGGFYSKGVRNSEKWWMLFEVAPVWHYTRVAKFCQTIWNELIAGPIKPHSTKARILMLGF